MAPPRILSSACSELVSDHVLDELTIRSGQRLDEDVIS